jgi:hypothetical protein
LLALPVIRQTLEAMQHDAAAPAAVRLTLAEDADAPDRVWRLCTDDTGVWPRLVIAAARESGIDPTRRDVPFESDEQRFWWGLLFGRSVEEIAPFAPDSFQEMFEAKAPVVGPTSEPEPDGAPEPPPEPDVLDGAAGEDVPDVGGSERWRALAEERAEVTARLSAIDEEAETLISDAVTELRDWLTRCSDDTAEALRRADGQDDTADPDLDRLTRDLDDLLATEEAALAHTHSSLRETLRAGYDARAQELRDEIDRRRDAIERERRASERFTVGAAWLAAGCVVVAVGPLLEGRLETATVAALSRLPTADGPVEAWSLDDVMLAKVAIDGSASGEAVAVAIAEEVTRLLADDDGWPEEASVDLRFIDAPGPLEGVGPRAVD